MSPLYMDTGYEPNSPGSLSAEESHSNNAGSEKEGEGQPTEKRGSKRQEKNRDAARRSRRKQTERADELHEELQCLEQSNAALQKEIASLKKELQLYTVALERHEPSCSLRESSSTTRLSVSPSVGSSSPPRVPASTQAAAPPLSTSLTPSLGLQTLNCVESTHLSSSMAAPMTTTLASSTASSPEIFTSSSPVTAPYSVSFSAVPAPHSLFCDGPPTLIASRPTNATPVCASFVSNPQPRQGAVHELRPSVSAITGLSAPHPLNPLNAFPASCNVVPTYSHLASENAGLLAQRRPMNVPQPHPGLFRGNPVSAPQANLEPPACAFSLKPSYTEHVTVSSAPLLSLLTIPSPLNVPQTTSSSLDGPLSQPSPSQAQLGDPSKDFSLSELLEGNDWILQLDRVALNQMTTQRHLMTEISELQRSLL